MKKPPFPSGLVLTLALLWMGTLGAMVGGWAIMRDFFESPPSAPPSSAASIDTRVPASGTGVLASGSAGRLVWTPEAFWRFSLKAGAAALGAILYLLLSIGAGFLMQEKVESLQE